MIRFILNFFLYGILFYLISVFFPDTFATLISWANHVVVFVKDLAMSLWAQIQSHTAK